MARRDRSQGFAFILSTGVVNFNKDLNINSKDMSETASLYDLLIHAMDLLDHSDYTDNEIIDALIDDLKKFKGQK